MDKGKRLLAFVGMPGSGKSLASEFCRAKGLKVLHVGELTLKELKRQGLEVNEQNERLIREELRKKFGMAVYAERIAEKVENEKANLIILDGLRSFAEYEFLKKRYGDNFCCVAILASPKKRYERLMQRPERPLNEVDCLNRDLAEMKNLDLAKTIVMADYFIVNETFKKEEFQAKITELLKGKNFISY